jgi:hypothetical protein
MLDTELEDLVAGLRRIGRDDAGLEVKLASTASLPSGTANTLCAFANTPGGGALMAGRNATQYRAWDGRCRAAHRGRIRRKTPCSATRAERGGWVRRGQS